MTSFVGPAGVNTFVAIALKSGISIYAKTGMKPNRQWTPTKMLAKATEITGQRFKRGQFQLAILALQDWIEKNGTTGQ